MRPLCRPALVLLTVLAVVGTGSQAGGAAPETTKVHVIEVDGPIDRPLRGYVEERLAEAERVGAVVVLELDTPGALGQDG
ncbi:MAG: hypothetical protein H0W97_08755, partial [Actinobacteria bacterium]|nr:hypothetical protein [Actinomycetota bacterium]